MKKKLNALLLTFCIVFSVVAAVLPVYAVEADGGIDVVGAAESVLKAEKLVLSEDDVPEVISFQSAQEKGHILRLRDKEADDYTVVFLNDDNTETMYLFAEPVKYTDEYGNKKDKSTALTLKNNAYTMAENDISVSFPREVANGISISKGDISISMSPVTTTVSDRLTASTNTEAKLGRVSENKMVYTDVFAGASLVYTPLYSGFKEDIVLDRFDGVNEFSFIVNTNGLYPIKQENGAVWFYDPYTDELVAKMMQVVCYDSENDFSEGDVRITEVKENQIYTFTIIADTAFLTDENTAYPVYIDPTITLNTETAIEDTVVYSGKPSRNYGTYSYLNVGYVDDSYKNGEMLVKFPTLATNYLFTSKTPDDVLSCSLVYYTASGKSGTQRIKTYQLNMGNWYVDSVTWSSIPVFAPPTLLSTTTVSTNGGTATTIDITNAARTWADSSSSVTPNQGLIICNETESDATKCRDFMSVDYAASSSSREQYMPRLELQLESTYVVIPYSPSSVMYYGQTTYFDAYMLIDGNPYFNNGMLLRYTIPYPNDAEFIRLNSEITGSVTAIGVTPGNYKATLRVYHNGFPSRYADILIDIDSETISLGQPNDPVSKFQINNDDIIFQNTSHRFIQLSAYAQTANGISYDVKYSLIDYDLGFPDSYINHPGINVTVTQSGRISYQIPAKYYSNEGDLAHPVGTIRVKASCQGVYRQIEKTITVPVVCSPLDAPQGNTIAGIQLLGARYIQTNFDNLGEYSNARILKSMADSIGITCGNDKIQENFARDDWGYDSVSNNYESFEQSRDALFNFNLHYWHTATIRDSVNTYQTKLLELFRNSRVVCFNSHGSPGSFLVSSQYDSSPPSVSVDVKTHKYAITSEDIALLHDGYFAYTDLILLTTCYSGNASIETGSQSIAEAFVSKGAGCVIGFNIGVESSVAQNFEYTFLTHISALTSEMKSGAYSESCGCSSNPQTFREAFDKTIQHLGIDPESVYIIGPETNETLQ